MSESEKNETTVAEEIQKFENRILASFLAKDFSINEYNGEQIIFIHGKRGEKEVDIVLDIDNAEEMAKAILEAKNNEQSGELDSLAQS
jgi:hypothetical protein